MIGQRLGHYEILSELGRGGMGEVYRARDTKLGRDVAIKVLPPEFAEDPDRLARFEREAKLLASLNHANIAAIYGLEEHESSRFLVLELVEGDTLADRIRRGPIPVGESLNLAAQIAAALEAAHQKGVIHRDLKPANIKVTPDGQVKVLDFGLAKAFVADEADPNLSNSPTVTMQATQSGTILGTAAYMSPEQARGQDVDRRTDIWAFGCVLYEMLTGKPAFDGQSVPDTLAQVLGHTPDWAQIPSSVPSSVRRLLRLCFEREPARRRQSAGDVRVDIEQSWSEAADASPGVSRPGSPLVRLALIVTAAAVVALAILAAIHFREAPAPEVRLQIVTPSSPAPLEFAVSPDGQSIVFVAFDSSEDTSRHLYLRTLDQTEPQPLEGTEGAEHPFWSPDSRSLGFFASEMLFRLNLAGGPPQQLAPAPYPLGGTWNADGTILFAPHSVSPLFMVAESGGEAVAVTELASNQKNHRFPSFLPDGRRFLFYAEGEPEGSGIYMGSLDGGVPRRLTAAASAGVFLAPDLVVFAQDGALVARRLDAADGELIGDPLTLASAVGTDSTGLVAFSASSTGVLAYRTGSSAPGRLTWFDRAGNVLELGEDLNGPDLSADGRYIAYDRTIGGNRDVWILDTIREGSTRFTTHPDVDGYPLWSPDGRQLVFESQRNGTFDLWSAPYGRGGAEELLLGTSANEIPVDWSSDGRFVLYRSSDENYASSDLWALPMTGDERTPVAVANTRFEERMGEFSPDGRWVAYETDESGRFEIVAQEFPEPNGVWPVSTGGGVAPRWSKDGNEIYYVGPDNTMMAVRVETADSTFEADRPARLFATWIGLQAFNFQYDVSRDGRFLVNNRELTGSVSPITVLLNWTP